MSSIKKTPGAGSAFKNAQLHNAQHSQQTQTPQAPVDAKQVQKQAISEFAQRTAADPALGKAAVQVGKDGQMVDADGEPLKGSALLQARLDAMTQSKEPAQPSVNPFPDTGVTVEEPPQPSVNPFPDTGVTTEPLTTEPAEPTVNPFPDTGTPAPGPGPDIAINPIPDGRVPGAGDDES
jgi:hypothetical protein